MHAAEIDDELAVDEDPEVVVAGEREDLLGDTRRRVAEREQAFEVQREVVVVDASLVAERVNRAETENRTRFNVRARRVAAAAREEPPRV